MNSCESPSLHLECSIILQPIRSLPSWSGSSLLLLPFLDSPSFPFPSSLASILGTAWPTHQPPPRRRTSRPIGAETTATGEAEVETGKPATDKTASKTTNPVVGAEVGVVDAEEGHKPSRENNPRRNKCKQKARLLLWCRKAGTRMSRPRCASFAPRLLSTRVLRPATTAPVTSAL